MFARDISIYNSLVAQFFILSIEAKHIQPTTAIAAPGVPLGLSPEAQTRIESRLIHDPLQIGVATMMAFAVNPSTGGPSS